MSRNRGKHGDLSSKAKQLLNHIPEHHENGFHNFLVKWGLGNIQPNFAAIVFFPFFHSRSIQFVFAEDPVQPAATQGLFPPGLETELFGERGVAIVDKRGTAGAFLLQEIAKLLE